MSKKLHHIISSDTVASVAQRRWSLYVLIVVLLISIKWFESCKDGNRDLALNKVDKLIDSANNEHNANNILASFEILSKAREEAHKNGFTEEYVTCLNMLSRLYAYIDDFEEATQLNDEAYTIATQQNDSVLLMKVLNNRGVLAGMQSNRTAAKDVFHNLNNLATQRNDSVMMRMSKRNLAGIELALGNHEEALTLIAMLLKSSSPNTEDNAYWELRNMQATIYDQLGDKHKAILIWDSLLTLAPESSTLRQEAMRKLALLEADAGNRESALSMLRKADTNSDPISRYLLYLDYSKAHQKTGHLTEALGYKDSALLMMDSVHSFAQKSYHHNSSLRFGLLKKDEEAKVTALKTKIWLLIALSTILALLMAYLYLNRKRRIEKLTAELELIKMGDELKRTREEQSELQLKLDDYIEKLKCHELSIAARDNLMKEVSDYLSSEGDPGSNRVFLAKMKSISADSDNLDSFLNHTRQTHPELFTKLVEKHPALNQNDLRYISLVFLQLSVNEIASLLNITPAASKKRKQRICSKIGLDSTMDLYTYLLSI